MTEDNARRTTAYEPDPDSPGYIDVEVAENRRKLVGESIGYKSFQELGSDGVTRFGVRTQYGEMFTTDEPSDRSEGWKTVAIFSMGLNLLVAMVLILNGMGWA